MIFPDNFTVYMNGRQVCSFYQNGERLSLSIDTSCFKGNGAGADRMEPPPKRREITISAKSNGKSVTITYDPSDAEAVKAVEAWRGALFSAARWTYEEPIAVCPGDTVTFAGQRCRDYQPTLDALKKASEPLRDYLKAHGDPHTSIVVTQDSTTVKQDERGVKFRDDELLKRVKNAPLTADGTTATQPEPEPDVLEFDCLRDELVDPLPFDVIGLWGQVAEEFLKAHEQAWAAWKEGKRARIQHSMIDALESLSKRLSADLEKAVEIKSEPAKPKRDILNGRFS